MSSWILRVCSRCAGCSASCSPRWYPRPLARRAPLNLDASLADKLAGQLRRFACQPLDIFHGISIRSEKSEVKLDQTTEGMFNSEMRKVINDVNDRKAMAADDIMLMHVDDPPICNARILKGCTHRDGAIYKTTFWRGFSMDITDYNETVSELEKTYNGPCQPHPEFCVAHMPASMIQIFSLRLAKTPITSGSIQLYGYMAARDDIDGLRNYVFNHSRDNPVVVQQDSLLEMTGPRRAILMFDDVLMEFDMRIKTGEKEEDDFQLIDGLTNLHRTLPMTPLTFRFNGSCGGAVDMCFTLMEAGMQGIIEVTISQVRRAFNLSLSSFVLVTDEPKEEYKEFEVFHGTVRVLGTKRFVVAAPAETTMHLKFEVGKKGSGDVHYCSFNSKYHGCTSHQIKLEVASISVKVTWSTPHY